MYSTLKRRGNGRFHVVSSWNTRGVFVGKKFKQHSSISLINPFQTSVAFHIETNRLICRANQMAGFYMKCNIYWNGFNNERFHVLPTEQRSILKEITSLDNKKWNSWKTFLLTVSRMYQISVALFWQLPKKRKSYLTKIFLKILN